MTFSIQQGDLFDPAFEFDALAQGVNTLGVMGAGIAVPFKEKWPEMYEEYHALCVKHKSLLSGLLHVYEPEPTFTEIESDAEGIPLVSVEFGQTIYNLFSQTNPGRDGSYELLQKATLLMLMDAESQGFERVGLPWIGCGIAGLERHNVKYIFEQILGDSEVDFILVQQDEVHPPVKPEEVAHLDQTPGLITKIQTAEGE
jgi:O-acetyl-ADP-ribose deacetylase (regulator of RNase III)